MDFDTVIFEGKRFLTCPRLSEAGLLHYFSTGDQDASAVTAADLSQLADLLARFRRLIGRPQVTVVGMRQRHTDRVAAVTDAVAGEPEGFWRRVPEVDGLVTDQASLALYSTFADCIPVVIYDPIRRVQANVHSGWRGTWKKIAARAVSLMQTQFGSDPQELLVALGPHIRFADFEVSQDVADLFQAAWPRHPEMIRQISDTKYLVDLTLALRLTLLEAGLADGQIAVAEPSTVSSPDLLHSYRRDGQEAYGLMACLTCLARD